MNIISASNLISEEDVVLKIWLSTTTYYMLILLLGEVSDLVSILVLQKQESDTMLDSRYSFSLGECCPVNLEILELLCSVMKIMILKYCQ